MSDLLWLIQAKLLIDNRTDDLINVLKKFELPYQLVDVQRKPDTPLGDFSPEHYSLYPEPTHEGPIITNGSIMLSKIANARGWKPGSCFDEDNFSYERALQHLGLVMLNRDGQTGLLSNIRPELAKFFIRPLADSKTFTGRVIQRDEFNTWKAGYPADTPVLYAPVKQLGQEHRHYIVGGRVVTSSRYKLNRVPNVSPLVDQWIVDYVQGVADIWTPGPFCVFDSYVSGDDIGIVEIGCLSHAGLYAADLQKLVDAQIEYING